MASRERRAHGALGRFLLRAGQQFLKQFVVLRAGQRLRAGAAVGADHRIQRVYPRAFNVGKVKMPRRAAVRRAENLRQAAVQQQRHARLQQNLELVLFHKAGPLPRADEQIPVFGAADRLKLCAGRQGADFGAVVGLAGGSAGRYMQPAAAGFNVHVVS